MCVCVCVCAFLFFFLFFFLEVHIQSDSRIVTSRDRNQASGVQRSGEGGGVERKDRIGKRREGG